MSIFGVEIDQIVSDAFSGRLQTATLTRENKGDYDAVEGTYSNGSADSTYTTDGIVDTYEDRLISEGVVQQNDRKILLIAKKLGTTPKAGDTITIESVDHTVVGVPERDPAGATWIVQGRIA